MRSPSAFRVSADRGHCARRGTGKAAIRRDLIAPRRRPSRGSCRPLARQRGVEAVHAAALRPEVRAAAAAPPRGVDPRRLDARAPPAPARPAAPPGCRRGSAPPAPRPRRAAASRWQKTSRPPGASQSQARRQQRAPAASTSGARSRGPRRNGRSGWRRMVPVAVQGASTSTDVEAPARLPGQRVGGDHLGGEPGAREVLAQPRRAAARDDVERGDRGAGGGELQRLAPGRGAEVERRSPGDGAEQPRRQRRGGVLHPPGALGEAGQRRDLRAARAGAGCRSAAARPRAAPPRPPPRPGRAGVRSSGGGRPVGGRDRRRERAVAPGRAHRRRRSSRAARPPAPPPSAPARLGHAPADRVDEPRQVPRPRVAPAPAAPRASTAACGGTPSRCISAAASRSASRAGAGGGRSRKRREHARRSGRGGAARQAASACARARSGGVEARRAPAGWSARLRRRSSTPATRPRRRGAAASPGALNGRGGGRVGIGLCAHRRRRGRASPAIASSARMRFSTFGWVENRLSMRAPVSGLTMNIGADAGLRSALGISIRPA